MDSTNDFSDTLDLSEILNADAPTILSMDNENSFINSLDLDLDNQLFINTNTNNNTNSNNNTTTNDNNNNNNNNNISIPTENQFSKHTQLFIHNNDNIADIKSSNPVFQNISSDNLSNNSNLIDADLLSEIDSLLNDTNDTTTTTITTTNNNNNNNNDIKISKMVTKKPSFKRLSTSTPQSPTTKRLAKSPIKLKDEHFIIHPNEMAQTAAMVATSSSPNPNLSNLKRNESARAAARAVGNTIYDRRQSNIYQTNIKRNLKLVSSNNPNNLLTTTTTSSSLAPPITTSSLLPPRNLTKNSNYKSNKLKPSSCSIYSSATLNSVKTIDSNNSKFSNSSKSSNGSGTFDIYTHIPNSTDTLETIISTNKNDLSIDSQLSFTYENENYQIPPPLPLKQYSNNNNNTYNYNNYKQPQNQTQLVQSVRTNSTQSTQSNSSTSSLTDLVYTSTPSPVSNSFSNLTFTPPTIINQNQNNQNLLLGSNLDAELFNINGSPITPVTKTALKFEQLSTSSPIHSINRINNINKHDNIPKPLFNSKPPQIKLESVASAASIPKLSVWKTSPTLKNDQHNPLIQFPNNLNTSLNNSSIENTHNNLYHKIEFNINENPNYVHNIAKLKDEKVKHGYRNSVNSLHSTTSTNSTISNSSLKVEKNEIQISIDQSNLKRSTKPPKDAAFKSLITTFNKKEPESYKPKVYNNMMQGLVEFQVKLGRK